jgi:hypothetical protein
MKLFNKMLATLILGVGLLVGGSNTYGVIQSFTVSRAGANIINLLNGAVRINTITIISATTTSTNLLYAVLDASQTNSGHLAIQGNSWLGIAWTNSISSISSVYSNNSIAKLTTNFTGIIYTNLVSGLLTTTNTVGGWTNLWDLKYGPTTLGSNGAIVVINFGGAVFSFGLSVTNSRTDGTGDNTVIVDYDNVL